MSFRQDLQDEQNKRLRRRKNPVYPVLLAIATDYVLVSNQGNPIILRIKVQTIAIFCYIVPNYCSGGTVRLDEIT
jgi:hypothetical protein